MGAWRDRIATTRHDVYGQCCRDATGPLWMRRLRAGANAVRPPLHESSPRLAPCAPVACRPTIVGIYPCALLRRSRAGCGCWPTGRSASFAPSSLRQSPSGFGASSICMETRTSGSPVAGALDAQGRRSRLTRTLRKCPDSATDPSSDVSSIFRSEGLGDARLLQFKFTGSTPRNAV